MSSGTPVIIMKDGHEGWGYRGGRPQPSYLWDERTEGHELARHLTGFSTPEAVELGPDDMTIVSVPEAR